MTACTESVSKNEIDATYRKKKEANQDDLNYRNVVHGDGAHDDETGPR